MLAGSLSKILQDLESQGLIDAKQTEKFISYVMGKLDEPESAINSQMWDAALHLVHNFKVSCRGCNAIKALLSMYDYRFLFWKYIW